MENEEEKKEVVVREVVKEKKRIKLPKLSKIVIIVIIIFILLGGSIVGIGKVFESQEKVLKLGLEDVGELVTQTCHTVVLEDSKESRTFFDLFDIPFTESRQIFSYDFDVDASIDFSKIEIENIDDSKKEVIIKLPHSRVYKIVLLPDSFKSYLDSDGLFTRIDLSEHNDAIIRMESIAENQCLDSNLLVRADDNAKKLLSSMVKSEKKYKEYNVVFNYIVEDNNLEEDK